jgi:hypothetical protein
MGGYELIVTNYALITWFRWEWFKVGQGFSLLAACELRVMLRYCSYRGFTVSLLEHHIHFNCPMFK